MPKKTKPVITQTEDDRKFLERYAFDVTFRDGEKRTFKLGELNLGVFNLCVGDLVQLGGQGLNAGGIVWRIVEDFPPRTDAVRVRRENSSRPSARARYRSYKRNIWCDPITHKEISITKLQGAIKISPVFCFMPFVPHRMKKGITSSAVPKSKTIQYDKIQERIRLIDLMELGSKWSEMKDLIDNTLKERS